MQPPASPFNSLEITLRSHGAEKEGNSQRKRKEEWGCLEANGQREVGLMAGCASRDVGRPGPMERDGR